MIETDRCPYYYSAEQLLPLTKKNVCSQTQQFLLLENSSFALLLRMFLPIWDFVCCQLASPHLIRQGFVSVTGFASSLVESERILESEKPSSMVSAG